MKTFLRFIAQFFFRLRGFNTDVLKTPGPVLLLPNHLCWFDWLFLYVLLDDDWRFVTSSSTAQTSWFHRKVMINRHTFPVENDSPYAVKRMAEYLQKGGRMVLFPEGRLSQTGTLMKLFDGTGFLLHKTNAKVITCYLRGANRFILSPNRGWKKWFPKVTLHFSKALTPPKLHDVSAAKSRSVLTSWIREQMVRLQFETEMEFGPATIPAAIVEQATFQPKHLVLEDVTRKPLAYRKFLIAADLLAKQMVKKTPHLNPLPTRASRGEEEVKHVGVLLPNVAATPIVLMSLWCLGKVPAILNYSTGAATMLVCAQLAGLKQIVTSKLFVEKAKLNLQPLIDAGIQFIYVEDLKKAISTTEKLQTALHILLKPKSILQAATFSSNADDTAVILFTSGSEGVPKGVELTHRNLLANIRQMLATTDLQDNDRIFCSLPLFHSFGLTVGTLLPLVRGMYVFVYPSPLHYRVVPTAFYDTNCTVMLGTNTFLNGYARKAHPYDFRSLRYMFAAAEKLQEATAQTWAQKFGVRILEGYGATECAPCVSVNTPLEPHHGSVGKLMPGMEYRLEPVEGVGSSRGDEALTEKSKIQNPKSKTDQSLLTSAATAPSGRLFVRGPNVMKGYLNPDANEKYKALNGWYDTGDIVKVDENGFITILGRMKRFAKISGEMVSLTAVEDALAGAFPQYGLRCQVAVVSIPDEDKGERLIAASNEQRLTLEEIRTAIKAKGLSNLCVPREVKFVREIPKLGTGKTNHRELQKLIE